MSVLYVTRFTYYSLIETQADVRSTDAGITCQYCMWPVYLPQPCRDTGRRPVDWCRNWMSVLYATRFTYLPQPCRGTGRRPVDWCRNWMSVLYATRFTYLPQPCRGTGRHPVINVCTVCDTFTYNSLIETLADIRSTDTGIKCLYCMLLGLLTTAL